VSAPAAEATVDLVRTGPAVLAVAGDLLGEAEPERGVLIAQRRRDEAEAIVPARVRGRRFEAGLDLVLLLGAHRRSDVWDLFFQAGPGAPRLRLALARPEETLGALHVGSGRSRRELQPYATEKGNLSIRSRRAAEPKPPARPPPRTRRTPVGRAKRIVARALNRAGLRMVRPLVGVPRSAGASPPERPRVVFVLMSAWGMGGTIRTTLNLAGHLAQRHDVTILSATRARGRAFLPVPDGVRLVALSDRRGAAGALQRLLDAAPGVLMPVVDRSHWRWSMWTDVRLIRELRRLRPHVLVGTRPGLNLLVAGLRPAGCATIGVEHLNLSVRPRAVLGQLRRGLPSLDALVVLTEADLADAYEQLGDRLRVVAIPNPAPPVDPEAAPLAEPVIVGAGRLRHQKGFDRLVRAFAPVAAARPDWTLRIFGDGERRAELEALVAELGLTKRVALPGRVTDLAGEMRRASIFALSSRFEGLPMVLVEAMSRGLAIVSFDCRTGPREVLDDGHTGVLVPDGDEAAFTRALLALIDDPERCRRLGAAARERAAGLSLAAVGARWDALLAELVAERGRAGRSALAGPAARVLSGHEHGNG
jgi:glycosyltransferase involved in cell wall biosynthesis